MQYINSKRGGSIASDAVVELVTCNTFDQMSQLSTNSVTGGAWGKKTAPRKKAAPKKRRVVRGGSDCDPSAATSVFDSYAIGPATVPSGTPALNNGSIDYSTVQGSVLTSLAQSPPSVVDAYHNIILPSYLPDNQIAMKMQFGGMVPCMCDS